MAPREDLVSSAVNFLRDPSVASSPIEKRIEFLKSKNLTQEEIDLSLSQASGDSAPSPNNAPYYPPQQYQRPPPGYNYGYPPYGQWQQPPPEPPKRDWRDWFIMATVLGGTSYGIYALAQRYIKPLIAPPTPPQLEQDKAAIDEQFNRAFALLDTLAQDTDALKQAEQARTEKLDTAITDIESIVSELKAANLKREDDARRMEAEVKSMKDSLPRAIDSVRDGSERQLKELSTELASLKALMSNRMGSTTNPMFASQGQNINARPQDSSASTPRSNIPNPLSMSEVAPGSKANVTGVSGISTTPSFATPNTPYSSTSGVVPPAASSSAKPSFGGKSASIPAWQMAAQNMAAQNKSSNAPSSSSTGAATTPVPQQDGADAVAALMGSSHNN